MTLMGHVEVQRVTERDASSVAVLPNSGRECMRMLPAERVRELFDYDADAGVLRWRMAVNGHMIGDPAAHVRVCADKPYRFVSIEGAQWPEHRLVVCHVTGAMPRHHIDHIDGNGLNNKFSNLRDVPHHENLKNLKLSKRSRSGIPGVRQKSPGGPWHVTIGVRGQNLQLGSYAKFGEAVRVRRDAEVAHGFHPNHGRIELQDSKKNFVADVTYLRFVATENPVVTPLTPYLEPSESVGWYEIALWPDRMYGSAFGVPLDLTRIEFLILELLVSAQGLTVPRAVMWAAVYGTPFDPRSRALDVQVARVRSKLRATNQILRATKDVGYRLECRSPSLAKVIVGRPRALNLQIGFRASSRGMSADGPAPHAIGGSKPEGGES